MVTVGRKYVLKCLISSKKEKGYRFMELFIRRHQKGPL